MVRGTSLRDIAGQFQISKSNLNRHQKCIAEAIATGRMARQLRSVENIDRELEECFTHARLLRAACHEWLLDPDDPTKYTLEARSGDITVIFDEQVENGTDSKGDTRYKALRQRGKLNALLLQVAQGTGYTVVGAESKYSDPRKLILDSFGSMSDLIDKLAKLTGQYQQDRQNEDDKRERREIAVEALWLLSIRRGEQKTREEIAEEMDRDLRELNSVWNEAKQNAQKKGFIM